MVLDLNFLCVLKVLIWHTRDLFEYVNNWHSCGRSCYTLDLAHMHSMHNTVIALAALLLAFLATASAAHQGFCTRVLHNY